VGKKVAVIGAGSSKAEMEIVVVRENRVPDTAALKPTRKAASHPFGPRKSKKSLFGGAVSDGDEGCVSDAGSEGDEDGVWTAGASV
jgi:hypothetical protein